MRYLPLLLLLSACGAFRSPHPYTGGQCISPSGMTLQADDLVEMVRRDSEPMQSTIWPEIRHPCDLLDDMEARVLVAFEVFLGRDPEAVSKALANVYIRMNPEASADGGWYSEEHNDRVLGLHECARNGERWVTLGSMRAFRTETAPHEMLHSILPCGAGHKGWGAKEEEAFEEAMFLQNPRYMLRLSNPELVSTPGQPLSP